MAGNKTLKIGILTFHYAHNYGAVLQCYALQQMLSNLYPDANVCVVDYQNQKIKNDYKIFHLNTKNPYRLLRSLFGSFVYFFDRAKRSLAFHNFVKHNLNIGSSNFNDYDVIFYGSDQIWNPVICGGLENSKIDPIYFGANFSGVKIAYGASDGNQLEVTEDVKKSLNSFSAISVREKTLAEKLSSLNRGISVVCDPVFLLSKDEWLSVAKVPKEMGYILAYKIGENPDFDEEAEALGKRLNKKVIQSVYVKPLKKIFYRNQKLITSVSPLVFVGLIANADFVVTTSFHGTAFSILLEKPFYVLKIKTSSERITDLLKTVGLEDRYVEKIPEKVELHSGKIFTAEVKENKERLVKTGFDFIFNSDLRRSLQKMRI